MRKEDIHEAEYEVAADILKQHNTIKSYIKKLRTDYYESISGGIRYKYDISQIKKEFTVAMEKKIQEHHVCVKKMRFMLNLNPD